MSNRRLHHDTLRSVFFFSLEDGIVLMGALLQLNSDTESTILEAAYRSQRLRGQSNVNRGTLIKVLDDCIVSLDDWRGCRVT